MEIDDFLVTASNQEAVGWISRWPNWHAHGLVLTGLSGSGKTHAMALWLSRSGGRKLDRAELVSTSASELCAAGAVFAYDDVDNLAQDTKAEEALFHLYNRVKELGGHLVLTLSKSVTQAGFALPDLRSRLLTLPVAHLDAPDDTLLEGLIVKQFRDRQITLDVGVVSYLAARASRDAASLRALVDRLDQVSLAQGRRITVALARSILESPNV